MVYDTRLAERIGKILSRRPGVAPKQMFGGISFLRNGKMFCGVLQEKLVVRVNPETAPAFLKKPCDL